MTFGTFQSFFLEEKIFDLQSDPSDKQPVVILSLSFPFAWSPTLSCGWTWAVRKKPSIRIRVCCMSPESYCTKKLWKQPFANCCNIICHTLAFPYFLQKLIFHKLIFLPYLGIGWETARKLLFVTCGAKDQSERWRTPCRSNSIRTSISQ